VARILVIEDHQEVREVLVQALSSAGYSVLEAENGRDALRHLEDTGIDLVITDILMPEKDGLEVLMEIRARNRQVQVIAMSSGGHIGPRYFLDTARALGAARTFTKPFDMNRMMDAVKELTQDAAA
jgi:CheY-like chemotaxis protein